MKQARVLSTTFALVAFLAGSARGQASVADQAFRRLPTTTYVPDNHLTIQGAIEAALDGDTIVVRPGTYVESIDFVGKAITVKSEQGAAVTIIDGNNVARVAVFQSGEGRHSVLDGFTIANGRASPGGGILILDSSPSLVNCVICRNAAATTTTPAWGGGLCNSGGNPSLTNCIFYDNSADCFPWGFGYGGGMSSGSGNPTVTNCVFYGNRATGCGGGLDVWNGNVTVTNTIVWDNTPDEISQNCVATFSDVKGGWPGLGNIDADPFFVDPARGDFRLQQDPCQTGAINPCVDAGDPNSPMLAGTTRTDWVQDAGVVDMGYHEAIPSASATIRTAGSNPASYTVTAPPVLGGTFSATVDHTLTGHLAAVLAGYEYPWNVTIPQGVLLVDITSQEYLGFPVRTGAPAVFNLPVPSDPAFAGLRIYTQAVHVGGVMPLALSSAQDLVLGF